jgi:hypothetical protein
MKRNKLVLSLALTSVFLSGHVRAAEGVGTGEASVRTSTQLPATMAAPPITPTTAPTEPAPAPYYIPSGGGGGGNAADSGRKAAMGQVISAAGNVAIAGSFFAPKCASAFGGWACPLAGIALAAAGSLVGAARGSTAAGDYMSAYGSGGYAGTAEYDQAGNLISGGTNPDGTPNTGNGIEAASGGIKLPDGTTISSITKDIARIRGELEKSGASLSSDGKTMTMKGGRKFDLTKGGDGSREGLLAMGLTADEANQAYEASKKGGAAVTSKYGAMMAKLSAEGGGGGGRGPASDFGGGGGAGGFGGWGKDPFGKNRPKPKLSGLTKKLGDDTIGVSGDDIFEMVTRRYKARDQGNHFLKD